MEVNLRLRNGWREKVASYISHCGQILFSLEAGRGKREREEERKERGGRQRERDRQRLWASGHTRATAMDDSNAVSVDMETIYLGGKVDHCFVVRILRFDDLVIIHFNVLDFELNFFLFECYLEKNIQRFLVGGFGNVFAQCSVWFRRKRWKTELNRFFLSVLCG